MKQDVKRVIKLLPLFILVFILKTFGQTNVTEARSKFSDKELFNFLNQKLYEAKKLRTLPHCVIGATMAEFYVNKFGNIDSIAFHEPEGTLPFFREILTSVIKATDGTWYPKTINGKSVRSKPYILPFMYSLQASCWQSGTKITDKSYDSLFNLVGDKLNESLFQLDCVLLKPIWMSSVN